jgi:hypothetical protein
MKALTNRIKRLRNDPQIIIYGDFNTNENFKIDRIEETLNMK